MPPQISSVEYQHSDEGGQRRARPVGLIATCIILAIAALVLGAMVLNWKSMVASTQTQLNQANSELTRMKADLAGATAKSGDLQGQLDRATSHQGELQAQLTKDQGLQSNLQGQLRQAQTRLSSQAEQGRAQAADLQAAQSQLGQAKAASADVQRQLDQAKAQADDLKAQLAQAQSQAAKLQPAARQASLLPITTSIKKAFLGSSYTLHVKNSRSDPLKVDISITGSPKAPSRSATIAGGDSLQVDHLEAGAKVEITSENFNPVDLTVAEPPKG